MEICWKCRGRQGRRDGAEFYHTPGEMTRKTGKRDILAARAVAGWGLRHGGRLADLPHKSTGRPVDKSKKGERGRDERSRAAARSAERDRG